MKNLLKSFTLIAIMIMVPVICQAQAKPNFTGTWTFNAEKSKLPEAPAGGGGFGGGGGMRMGGGDMVITQDANLLTVETTRPGRDGGDPVKSTVKYTLDGKESVNAGGMGGERKSTATWSADGKSLKIATTMDFGGNAFTTNEEWSLVDGVLYQKRTMPGMDGGETTTTMAYSKK
ncbi:MAG TPA: hypothetical protein VHO50_01955 [Bacteroidales bacterium]|nr:hypothetical protein [Bacteroidales bacterium]